MAKKEIVLSSQKDAWNLINGLATAEVKASNVEVIFKNFPHLEIRYEGPQFKSSLPYRALEALRKVQDDVYSAYALAKYGDESHSLSPSEKENLEIVVKVNPGSSLVDVSLGEQAMKIMEAALTKMDPVHVIVVVTIFAIGYATPKVVRQFQETRRKRIDAEVDMHQTEQETKRIQALGAVITAQNEKTQLIVEKLLDNSTATSAKLAKVVREKDTVELGDYEQMESKEVKEEFKPIRSPKPDPKTYTREFMVRKFGWKNDFLHRVVTLESKGHDMTVQVPDERKELVNALYVACKEKEPITLRVEGRPDKDGDLENVTIVELLKK